MYLYEYMPEPWLSSDNNGHKIPPPSKTLDRGKYIIYMQYFQKCQILFKAQTYSCQLYVFLATGPQKVGRINRTSCQFPQIPTNHV